MEQILQIQTQIQIQIQIHIQIQIQIRIQIQIQIQIQILTEAQVTAALDHVTYDLTLLQLPYYQDNYDDDNDDVCGQ